MEQLYFNLSEEEFTKEREVMLWCLAVFFFLGSLYVLTASPIFGHKNMPPILAMAPFGISMIIAFFAILGKVKRKDLFFLVDYGKIEFRFGVFKAKRHSFKWSKILSLEIPYKQRKIRLYLDNNSTFVINLTFLKQRKSTLIKQHIHKLAAEKGIKVNLVKILS